MGNQIQFIPCIWELKNHGYVFTDSPILDQLCVCPIDNIKPDRAYFVYNYRRNWVVREFLKSPGTIYCGYVGRKSNIAKFFIDEWLYMNCNYTELYNNKTFYVSTDKPYHLEGWKPEKNRIALCVSHKKNKYYEHWKELAQLLEMEGFTVVQFGEAETTYYLYTPTISDLKEELSRCEFHISTDNGPAHLADILGIPGLTIWGDSELRGALVHSKIIMGLNTDATRVLSTFKEVTKQTH